MATTPRQRARISKIVQIAIFIGLVALVLLKVDWVVMREKFFAFDEIGSMFPQIITLGLKNTLFITVISFAFGLTLGLILALMKTATFAPYRWLATAYIEFFRGIPALLVLFTFGFGIPAAFPGTLWPLPVVAMVALGLVSAAYIAETLRAGLQAVPKGQMEAARSLGMPAWRAMVTIVIPQAFKIVLPPLTNEVILLTKDSSLIYVLGLTALQFDLAKMGKDSMLDLDAGITPMLLAGAMYLVVTIPLSLVARKFESRTARANR